ncbi:MAG: GTP-dependent nucleic acid-binding protein EngD [Parcubacteria group bacterium Licking1014_17]|nr:MAG: GTP-dependent nucleic acid-binding protein EngD [Parcubacteria group bacterium Licking1014_17]
MLSIGIVGLPNVGKSTLFKALTKKQVDISNYPFTTINPNVGVVAVPDERLELLAKMSHSAKVIPAAVEFIDIAGLVKGASQGEGLGNKFLANIREVDAIAEVVRVFEDENIVHVHKKIDPANDIDVIKTELIMADLETVTKRLEKTKVNDADYKIVYPALKKLSDGLQKGMPAEKINLDEKEKAVVRELCLLTNKKIIYVFNVSEKQLKDGWKPDENLFRIITGSDYVILSSTFELLLSESTPEEQKTYLEEIGLKNSGLDELIRKGYSTLGLLTFLTTGEDESRAWTAHIGDPIPRASRAIHTDFERLFICADVINWKELIKFGPSAGSGSAWSLARQAGKLRTEGKDYIIQEGDVVDIKIGR